jgi:hypothetical protein
MNSSDGKVTWRLLLTLNQISIAPKDLSSPSTNYNRTQQTTVNNECSLHNPDMPSYKFHSESDSESEIDEKEYEREPSDDGEPGPDDTFHFRQSFSKTPRHHAHLLDEDMNEPSFQTEEDVVDQSYDTMQEDFLSEEGSIITDDEEDEPQFGNDPLAAAVRIEKRSTWLEQIDYTDRAVKRLKAIDTRERLRNSKVHWGGRTPEIKYSAEDMERDLFGETPKVVILFQKLIVVKEEKGV